MSENFIHNLQSPTLILAEFTKLRDEIGLWAAYNFDAHYPELGIAEEVGELTHAVLKREQQIRGESLGQTTHLIIDSLADATIYALHLAYNYKLILNFARELTPLTEEKSILGAMHHTAGAIILNIHHFHSPAVVSVEHSFLLTQLWNFAELQNLNLLIITSQTWLQVSKRDWRKYPQNGLTA
jgi:hypothetical protein